MRTPLLALLPAACLVLSSAPAPARTETATAAKPAASCAEPMQGRYAVMGMGVEQSARGSASTATPTAHLLEERWLAGGALRGTLVERRGRTEQSASYSGRSTLKSSCVVELERQLPWGTERSEVLLDGRGRPLYSLNRNAGSVITSRWLPMAPGVCQAADLNGLVLSSQVGLSWGPGGWTPNAVVQREQWSNGNVQGLALSSYGGVGETVGYTGRLNLDAGSCWGSLRERDSKGVDYNYRALIVNGRNGARGYLYLQNDLNDLTAGWLVRD
ncbi:MAG: hypothetical protein FJ056_09165 [Cyanobacteria bacterium M_surface_10_m2_179]|nr:hypothetical protein [Cyanobacteria bacterium M_surface_10_m2_179]